MQPADHLTDLADLVSRTRSLLPQLREVGDLLIDCFARGGRLFLVGNGGSAATAQHLAGELIGHYSLDRRPLPAIALTADTAVLTCIANDYGYDDVFARQLRALAGPGDVVLAFTTSGRSANVVHALEVARGQGATTVMLGGGNGGPAAAHADRCLLVDHSSTARIQEIHDLLVHILSEQLDHWAAETSPPGGPPQSPR